MVKLNPEQRLHKSFGLTAGQLDKVFDRALGANRDSAFCDIALNDRPGGSMRPFWEPATVTSTPHSSMRKSMEPSDEIVSTISSAG